MTNHTTTDRLNRPISQPRDLSATHSRAYIADIEGEVLYFKTADSAIEFGAKEAFPVMVSNALFATLR